MELTQWDCPSNLERSVSSELVASLAEFAFYQSLDFKTISVEAFSFENDQYVVFAQPFNGKCSFLEWDHVEMVFRNYDEIESKSSIFAKRKTVNLRGPTAYENFFFCYFDSQSVSPCFVSFQTRKIHPRIRF